MAEESSQPRICQEPVARKTKEEIDRSIDTLKAHNRNAAPPLEQQRQAHSRTTREGEVTIALESSRTETQHRMNVSSPDASTTASIIHTMTLGGVPFAAVQQQTAATATSSTPSHSAPALLPAPQARSRSLMGSASTAGDDDAAVAYPAGGRDASSSRDGSQGTTRAQGTLSANGGEMDGVVTSVPAQSRALAQSVHVNPNFDVTVKKSSPLCRYWAKFTVKVVRWIIICIFVLVVLVILAGNALPIVFPYVAKDIGPTGRVQRTPSKAVSIAAELCQKSTLEPLTHLMKLPIHFRDKHRKFVNDLQEDLFKADFPDAVRHSLTMELDAARDIICLDDIEVTADALGVAVGNLFHSTDVLAETRPRWLSRHAAWVQCYDEAHQSSIASWRASFSRGRLLAMVWVALTRQRLDPCAELLLSAKYHSADPDREAFNAVRHNITTVVQAYQNLDRNIHSISAHMCSLQRDIEHWRCSFHPLPQDCIFSPIANEPPGRFMSVYYYISFKIRGDARESENVRRFQNRLDIWVVLYKSNTTVQAVSPPFVPLFLLPTEAMMSPRH